MTNGENDIDSLARMVAGGFKEVGQRFDELHKEVDERFDELHKEMDGRFDGLEKEVRQINQRLDKVLIPELDAHASRIKDLEMHTGIHA